MRREGWATRSGGGEKDFGVLLAGEGGGDGFAVAEGKETGADGGFFGGGGVGRDGERRWEGVGEAVVAVDAGYLFNEVDLAFEVESPGWELDGEDIGGFSSEGAAEGG